MKMAISRFFIRLKSLVHIATLILIVLGSSISSKADIGLTHELKQKRSVLLSEINELRQDSLMNARKLDSLQQAVISIDNQIMLSYDETVSRMADNARTKAHNSQLAVVIALSTTAVALMLMALFYMAQERIKRETSESIWNVYQRLWRDLTTRISAESASVKQLIRVNTVVVFGLIFMSISVIAFLLHTL